MKFPDNEFGRLLESFGNAGSKCWVWPGGVNAWGYGRITTRISGVRFVSPHRAAYFVFRGPIPDAMEIDHLCRNRRCVNPTHLEVVTPRENALRSLSPTAMNARKTHCKHGHEFTPENIRATPTKYGTVGRGCKACEKVRGARKRKGPPTACKKGHPFTLENTIVRGPTKRRCRICDNEYRARWAREQRAHL